MTTYQINTQVQLSSVFTDTTGTPVDPTDVIFYLKPPGTTVLQYRYSQGQVQRTGIGAYAINVETEQSGTYRYKWAGTGVAEVTSPDCVLEVQSSKLIAG